MILLIMIGKVVIKLDIKKINRKGKYEKENRKKETNNKR